MNRDLEHHESNNQAKPAQDHGLSFIFVRLPRSLPSLSLLSCCMQSLHADHSLSLGSRKQHVKRKDRVTCHHHLLSAWRDLMPNAVSIHICHKVQSHKTALLMVNQPAVDESDVMAQGVSRGETSQPVCSLRLSSVLDSFDFFRLNGLLQHPH